MSLEKEKGFPKEKHFILTMNASVKSLPVMTYAFDIYAQSESEAWEILKKFLRDDLERCGYQMVERGPLSKNNEETNMSVGEMIAALALCAASGEDYILMMKNVSSIEVRNECIEVYFVDGNTSNFPGRTT